MRTLFFSLDSVGVVSLTRFLPVARSHEEKESVLKYYSALNNYIEIYENKLV